MSAMIKKRGNGSKVWIWILRIAAFGVAIYGIYAFVKRQIGEYLFLRTHFLFLDPSEPLILFFIDYVAIMGLFVFIGHYLARLLRQEVQKIVFYGTYLEKLAQAATSLAELDAIVWDYGAASASGIIDRLIAGGN